VAEPERKVVAVVDAPEISLTEMEPVGDVLLKFYRALGWNGDDEVEPTKVRTTRAVFDRLYAVMAERCPDAAAVGLALVNKGPGVDDDIPPETVWLLEGWLTATTGKESNKLTAREFYDYLVENYNLDGAACRLIDNIICYVDSQDFADERDAHRSLWSLLDGAIGVTEQEIEIYTLSRGEPMKKRKREICIGWSVEDVLEVRPDLTDEQAMEVLENVEENHDAGAGICWDTLEFWADRMFPPTDDDQFDDEQSDETGELND